jgi:DNA-binding NarL/FixJ family response regulator
MATVNDGPERSDDPRARASASGGTGGPTVLVVDDHVGFRTELCALLDEDGLDVVAEAGTAADVLTLARRLLPAVVLLDVGLPDGDGIELVPSVRRASPGTVVVLVSGRREQDYGGRIAGSGADAFVEKAALVPGVIPALLDRVARG